MKTHDEMIAEWMRDPEFKKIYDNDRLAFYDNDVSLRQNIQAARLDSEMDQASVADKMNTSASAISRLENNPEFSPTIYTLRKYAQAVGKKLVIRFE